MPTNDESPINESELLCRIFSETEISLIIDSIHSVHMDDRPREMHPAPASAVMKFIRARELLAKRAAANAEFAASLTDTEREFIVERRQGKRK